MTKIKSPEGLPVFKVDNDEWYDLFNNNVVKDRTGKKYASVGHFLAEEPEELGGFVARVHVIMDEDGQYFGYFYYERGYDTVVEYNSEKYGLEDEASYPEDSAKYYDFYVYERVREFAITGYQRVE